MNNATIKSLFTLLFFASGSLVFAQEPTNYPTALSAATQSGTSIKLTWTGSIGANLPSDYVILVRVVPGGTFSTPADGTAIPNDTDLTDNLGAKNVSHAVGANTLTLTAADGLVIDTDYEFIIYPYKTGGAPNPDFKTNASAPTVTASTKRPTVTTPTVSAGSITDTGATLGGTVTSNGTNALTERGTVWSTSPGVTIADNKLAEGGTTVSSFTNAVSGFTAATKIYYAAYATNVAGSSLSSESFFYTVSVVPDNQPAAGSITLTSTATQVNLTIFPAASSLGNANGYVLLRRVGADPLTSSVQDGVAPASLSLGASTLVATLSSSATSYTDLLLTPDQDYHYALVPFNWNTTNPETYNYKVGSGFTIKNISTKSKSSNIVYLPGATSALDYKTRQATTIDNTDISKSYRLATFQIQDGGTASNDADTQPTSITSITMQITNSSNIRMISLFSTVDDSEIQITEQPMPASGIVTFTPTTPIRNVDDNQAHTPTAYTNTGPLQIWVRVTFNSAVIDNTDMVVTITSVTGEAGYSEFAAADGGGANSSANPNKTLTVNVSKFIIKVAPAPNPVIIGQSFGLTVAAVDSKNNIDVDYNRIVDLTISGGPGAISGAATSQAFASGDGLHAFSGLSISKAGNYTIDVSDIPHDNDYGNVTSSIIVTSSSSTISQPAPLNLCYGGIPKPLGDIVIKETDPAGFSAGGNFSLALPTGFAFDQTVTTAPVVSGGSDISGATTLSYPSANVVEFSYNITGTSNINIITISGLKINYPSTAAPSSTSITRSGGTAVIAGDTPGIVHGTVNASLGTTPVGFGFTVQALPGNVYVDPNETRFASTSNAVRLVGNPSDPNATFSGPGVTKTGTEYRFNPSALAVGTGYSIVYKYNDGSAQQCQFMATKSFEVYTTSITNLNSTYCSNAIPSNPLSVDPTYIASRYPGYIFQKFVYYDPTFGPRDIVPISTGPDVYVFNPQLTTYQTIYQTTSLYYGTFGIWIGFTVTNGISTLYEYILVPVKPAPSVTFTLPNVDYTTSPPSASFCADDLPITLAGNPANSDIIADDFFSATGGQNPSISSTAVTPVVWSFKPQSVTGVPTNFDMTYTYRDPITGCSGTSSKIKVYVNSRPATVSSSIINSGAIFQQLCQGEQVPVFNANDVLKTFNWYDSTFNLLQTGPSFNPPVDNTTAGTKHFLVTQTANGCESDKAPNTVPNPLKLTVKVNGTPPHPVSDITKLYCQKDIIATGPTGDLNISSGSNIKWYTSTGTLLILTNPTAPTTSDISSVLKINNTKPGTSTFNVTQTANNCEGILNPTIVSVTINSLPKLKINIIQADSSRICKTDPVVKFLATDGGLSAKGSTGTWLGVPTIIQNQTDGTATFDPATLSPGNYVLGFNFKNSNNCSNSTSMPLSIKSTIIPKLAPLDSCFGVFADLNNQSTIDHGTLLAPYPTINLVDTDWNFGDGTSLPSGNGAVSDRNTIGTYFSPKHKFTTTGNAFIQYTMITSDGCKVSATRNLNISPKPIVNFTWANVCRNVISATQFNAKEITSPTAIPIKTYDWIFNVNGNLSYTQAGTDASPVVNYDKDGKDSVNLIITSFTNCKDTIQKPVYIVPNYPAITETNSYNQNFEGGADGWLDGGQNSSWALGTSTGTYIKAASGNAWDTNLSGVSNPNEQSWVLSRCFDLTQAQKPIISLDIWSDTPIGNDGAVLQYNTTGNIEDDKNWKVLGTPNKGFNWYDASGISSSPGNQTVYDYGWNGVYNGWKQAVFKLDTLIGQSGVKFRIAFASNIPRRDGFSFDNVFIGERTRNVLVESFTNSSAAAGAKTHNTNFNKFSNTSPEIVKIEYHTSFPGNDALQERNAEMNDARTAFYGITKTANFSVDGVVASDALTLLKTYEDRVLTPSPLRIKIDQVMDGDYVRITTTLTNISNKVIPAKGLNLFTVIVEKSITDAAYLGNDGDTQFKFVARQMLPTASGLELPHDLAPGEVLAMPDVLWKTNDLISINSNQGAIAAFVQSIEGGDKNVLQAKVVDATLEPAITTGVEFPLLAKDVRIYPNPANEAITVLLPTNVTESTPVKMFDINGLEVHHSNFKQGEAKKIINTPFAAGIYIIQIETQNSIVRKKVMVMHEE